LIVALVKAYNSEKTIDVCLMSLHGSVDKIIVADGYYPDANATKYPPGRSKKSTDRTSEIAARFNTLWIPAPAEGYSSEAAKMNRMLDELQDGDWAFWVDTDEVLHGDAHDAVRDLGHSSEILPVKILHPQQGELIYARLFKYHKGMRMVKHWTIQQDNGPIMSLYLGPLAQRFWIQHL
jgi:hypothetical protein